MDARSAARVRCPDISAFWSGVALQRRRGAWPPWLAGLSKNLYYLKSDKVPTGAIILVLKNPISSTLLLNISNFKYKKEEI
jgi:hypothetical protein